MTSYQRDRRSLRPGGQATILFIVAIIGTLTACGSRAAHTSSAPSTSVQTIHTLYFMGQHDSVYALQSENGKLRWHNQLDLQQSVTASLLVFGDTLYVGRQTSTHIGEVDALKVSDGTLLWHSKVNVDNDAEVKVMAEVDGVVYVGVDSGFSRKATGDVYALQANNGSLLWHYPVKGDCCRGLVVTKTAIYIGTLYHVDVLKASDGTLLWQHQIDSPSVLLGIVVTDGRVYVGTAVVDYQGPPKGSVDALRANDGTLVWHSQTNIASVVLTVANGVVYVGEFLGQTLDALRISDGALIWQYNDKGGGGRGIVATTAMNDVAYITSVAIGYADNGSTIDALQVKDGVHLWRYKIDQGQIRYVVAANELIYVAGPGGIATLDGKNGKQRWFHADDNVLALAVNP